MSTDFAINLISEMLWNAALISGPILGVALIVGLIVSILQVVTQIQEMTLTFVPKILAVAITIFILGSWMLTTLSSYATNLIKNIPQII